MLITDLDLRVPYNIFRPDLGDPEKWDNFFLTFKNPRPALFTKNADPTSPLPINYSPLWLPWYEGYITEVECSSSDVLSGGFSGCYFVKYKRDGKIYVGHIGTDANPTSERSLRAKRTWSTFANSHDAQLICGFNPFRHMINFLQKREQKIYAVITDNNECYTFIAEIVAPSGLQGPTGFLKKILVTLGPDELKNIFPRL